MQGGFFFWAKLCERLISRKSIFFQVAYFSGGTRSTVCMFHLISAKADSKEQHQVKFSNHHSIDIDHCEETYFEFCNNPTVCVLHMLKLDRLLKSDSQ